MRDSDKKIVITVSEEMYDRLKGSAKKTGFETVEKYLLFVVSEITKEDEVEEPELSNKKEEEIKKQLEGLGYM